MMRFIAEFLSLLALRQEPLGGDRRIVIQAAAQSVLCTVSSYSQANAMIL